MSTDVRQRPGAEEPDVGAIVVSAGVRFVKRHKVLASGYVVGMIAAITFGGFAVDQATAESYDETMAHASHVTSEELAKAEANLARADHAYYNSKGWFFSCDANCNQKYEARNRASERVQMVKKKRDDIISEARQQVGVWSVYSVRDVRAAFWRAWQSGKDLASRWTMYDAFFMAVGGRNRDDGMAEVLIKLLFQFLANLTIGLISSFVYFCYEVYRLVTSYGPSLISGVLFFVLACCAGLAMVSTFLGGIFGAVGGGLYVAVKNAEKQQRLQGGPGRAQYQRVRHRAHYE